MSNQGLVERIWTSRRATMQSILDKDLKFLVRNYKTAEHFFILESSVLPLPPDSRPNRSEYFGKPNSIQQDSSGLSECNICSQEFKSTDYTENFLSYGSICPFCLVSSTWSGSSVLNHGISATDIESSLFLAKEVFSREDIREAAIDGFQTHHCENLAKSSREKSLNFLKALAIFPKSDYFATLDRSPRRFALEELPPASTSSLAEAICEYLSGAGVIHEHDKPTGGDYRRGGVWLFPDISFGQMNLFLNPTRYETAWAQIVLGSGEYRTLANGDNWVSELSSLASQSIALAQHSGDKVCTRRQ